MKVLFAGPSLADDFAVLHGRYPGIRFEGPVKRGDVIAAVRSGAVAIGIVDGLFRDMPSVWHKEILYALSLGVAVGGGASMGALRAAECGPFGMVGIGAVFALVASGSEIDDSCVAQVHAPEELGWIPLSEAAVTVDATIAHLQHLEEITAAEAEVLRACGRGIAFTDRTFAAVAAAATDNPRRRLELTHLLSEHRDDIKRRDGLAVLNWLAGCGPSRGPAPSDWRFSETSQWLAFLAEIEPALPPMDAIVGEDHRA